VSNIILLPATHADISYVARNLRPLDHEEFVATAGRDPTRVMAPWLHAMGNAMCAHVDDKPAAIYGCSVSPQGAAPWLVGTVALEGPAVARVLVKHGRELFDGWYADHGELVNYTFGKNRLHHRYLKFLGCELEDPQPYGALSLPFRKFRYVSSNAPSRSP